MPPSISNFGNYLCDEESLENYLDRISPSNNSLTFIGLDDFHKVINDCYAQKKYVKKAYDLVGEAIELIDDKLDINSFDITIMFSDHGFKARDEILNTDKKMLGNERTQIFLLVREKGG